MTDFLKGRRGWLPVVGLACVLLLLPVMPVYAVPISNNTSTLVSVAYFAATSSGSGVTFDWSTATETANAGFNLYAATADGMEQLNEALILSQAVDSTKRLDYGYTAAGADGETYYLEEVDVDGGRRMHGPYAAGEAFGARDEGDAIDWAAIGAELQAAETAPATVQSTAAAGGLSKGELGGQLAYPEFAFGVKEDGIYRVTYEDLKKATGVGLLGVPARSLALTNNGKAVPMRVVGGRIMMPGVSLEFVGEAVDTLYSKENVYILQVNRDLYSKMPTFMGELADGAATPAYYMETAAFEADKAYSVRATSDDPWYDTMLHTVEPKSWHFRMETDNLVSSAGATLNLELWGASNAGHHVIAKVNGAQAADINFDGRAVETVKTPVSNLKVGGNTLELTLPNDLGGTTDTVALEAYGVSYRRAFVANDGRLSFTADAAAFKVLGLSGTDVVAYVDKKGSGPQRIRSVAVQEGAVSFAGAGAGAYYVSSADAALKPRITLATMAIDIASGSADLLIISHANFIDGLAPLVAAREAQGYAVKVVDVNVIYRSYSGGVFDAAAIRQYVNHAITTMGVEYVLLVGGDTNNYLGANDSLSKSFVPSLYAQTSQNVRFAPVDPLYTDVNGDNVPDAAIGRFPVRLASELKMMVDKSLLYDQKSYGQTAVFAADNGFGYQGADMASALTGSWSINEAFLDDSTVSAARKTLIGSLNEGVALASYVGHSALYAWTGDGLFNVDDAKALKNYGKPAAVVQFGCFNTYYVDPDVNSLGHRFLLSGSNGAAVVSGATVLPGAQAEYELGLRMMPLLSTPGKPIGAAIQEAKEDLAKTNPSLLDVLLAYIILGDPTAVVVQSQ